MFRPGGSIFLDLFGSGRLSSCSRDFGRYFDRMHIVVYDVSDKAVDFRVSLTHRVTLYLACYVYQKKCVSESKRTDQKANSLTKCLMTVFLQDNLMWFYYLFPTQNSRAVYNTPYLF